MHLLLRHTVLYFHTHYIYFNYEYSRNVLRSVTHVCEEASASEVQEEASNVIENSTMFVPTMIPASRNMLRMSVWSPDSRLCRDVMIAVILSHCHLYLLHQQNNPTKTRPRRDNSTITMFSCISSILLVVELEVEAEVMERMFSIC